MKSVDEYIASFDPHIREKLNSIRSVITKIAADAQESISYGMPAYKLN